MLLVIGLIGSAVAEGYNEVRDPGDFPERMSCDEAQIIAESTGQTYPESVGFQRGGNVIVVENMVKSFEYDNDKQVTVTLHGYSDYALFAQNVNSDGFQPEQDRGVETCTVFDADSNGTFFYDSRDGSEATFVVDLVTRRDTRFTVMGFADHAFSGFDKDGNAVTNEAIQGIAIQIIADVITHDANATLKPSFSPTTAPTSAPSPFPTPRTRPPAPPSPPALSGGAIGAIAGSAGVAGICAAAYFFWPSVATLAPLL